MLSRNTPAGGRWVAGLSVKDLPLMTAAPPLATTATPAAGPRTLPLPFAAGAVIGVLSGMIGLGGAEFTLPLLIGLFGFGALQAEIVNKAMSLIIVITALPG